MSKCSTSGEALRSKFWEVAPLQRSIGITPFEKIRLSQDMLVSEVAERMGWESADYGELESGDIQASTKTILTFCKAMNCHPLDLYSPEAGPEMPLPREILYSLVAMVEAPDSNNERARSLLRLETEHRRAKTMVSANRDYFRPFLMAFGYAPDYRSYSAPLYDASQDNEDIGIRMVMELSLFEAQMRIEKTRASNQVDAEHTRKDIAVNKEFMVRKASALFGSNSADSAIAGLSALITHAKDKTALHRAFSKAPIIVGVPLQSGGDTDPSEVQNDKRDLFLAVERHIQLGSQLRAMNANAKQAGAELEEFISWRDKPKTLTLLDWYESYEVLSDFAKHPEPPIHPKSRTQPIHG